jgi:hypothetical protein
MALSKISAEELQNLKEAILKAYGTPLEYSRDCQALAFHIAVKTKKIIGESTIKRFFGFAATNYMPSNITLDTLSEYAYGVAWNEYKKPKQSKKEKTVFYPSNQAEEVTQYTIQCIKNRAGLIFDKVPSRAFTTDFLGRFLQSEKSATALVAAGGYGKSTMLAKYIEFILQEKIYKPNEVLFVSASSLAGLLVNKNFSLETWLQMQIGITTNESLAKHFSLHKQSKFLLIIDALDEVSMHLEDLERLFNQITDFCGYFSKTTNFKLILSMRISTWMRYTDSLNNAPSLQNMWFGVKFKNHSGTFENIPPLSIEEINQSIQHFVKNSHHFNNLLTAEIYHLLSYPYYLQLYINLINQNEQFNINDRADVVLHFINQKVYSGIYTDEKKQIIGELIKATDFGKKGALVEKKELKDLLSKRTKAYRELLSFGILIEEQQLNRFKLNTTFVKFGHGNLFEILLAIHLMEESKHENTNDFLVNIFNITDPEIGIEVTRWITILACKNENNPFLKECLLANLTWHKTDNWHSTNYIKSRLAFEIAFYMRESELLRKELIPYFAENKQIRELFFEISFDVDSFEDYWDEALDEYLKHAKSIENNCFALSIKYFIAFNKNNIEECHNLYTSLIGFLPELPKIHPFPAGRVLGMCFLHEKIIIGKTSNQLLSTILHLLNHKFDTKVNVFKNAPQLHIYILEGMYLAKDAKAMVPVFNDIEKKGYDFLKEDRFHHSYTLFKIIKSWYLYQQGVINKSKEIIESISEYDILFNSHRKEYFKVKKLVSEVLTSTYKG